MPCALFVELQNCGTSMENSIEFLKKLKTELSYDPAVPLCRIYPPKLQDLREMFSPHIHSRIILFKIAKKWKQLKCPLT